MTDNLEPHITIKFGKTSPFLAVLWCIYDLLCVAIVTVKGTYLKKTCILFYDLNKYCVRIHQAKVVLLTQKSLGLDFRSDL